MDNYRKNQSGQILLIAIVVSAVFISLSATLVSYSAMHYRQERGIVASAQALHLAQAGVDKAIAELNEDSNYAGETNTALGDGTLTVSVSTVSSATKRITVTGSVPNSTDPIAEKTVKADVTIDTSTASFNFGVQLGEGGLSMSNNTTINGSVFSNGNVSGSGIVTGDVSVAAGASATTDVSCDVQTGGFTFADDNSRRDVSQKFVPTVSGSLTKVSVYLKKTGTPNNLTVRIMPDNSGQANRTGQIGGSGTINSGSVTTSYGWVDVGFSTSPSLTAGTTYWLVLDGNTAGSYVWGTSTGAPCIQGTGKKTSSYSANPPGWTDISPAENFNFKTYMGGTTTTLSGITIGGNATATAMSSCTITGNATYETTNSCTVGGTSTGSTPAPAAQPLPLTDAQLSDWENDAVSGGTITGDQTYSTPTTLGPIKINGDLIVNSTLTLTGTVWVSGDITFNNNAALYVSASFGNNGAILIAHDPSDMVGSGHVSLSNNVIVRGNGNSGSFAMIIGAQSPVSGSAFDISNNVNQSENPVSSIFYSKNGIMNISNNAKSTQLTAYGMSLSNNANVVYNTGLQSATFANGPGGSWAFVPGSYVVMP